LTKVPITLRGAEKLREELKRHKSQERPRVIQAIAEARAHGDLKENAEYHAAKEQQGFIEARIKDIEGKLSHAQIIDVTQLGEGGKVVFGATVQLIEAASGEEITYRIVGEDEADIKNGLISVTSPIARALIGKEEGEQVTVAAPGGDKHYEIVEVRYVCRGGPQGPGDGLTRRCGVSPDGGGRAARRGRCAGPPPHRWRRRGCR